MPDSPSPAQRPVTAWEAGVGAVFVCCVFALGLGDVVDTDAWTHLAAGREVVRRGAVPELEPWSFAAQDLPFQYFSWLFGTAGYLAYSWFGMAGVVLLRASIIAAAFAVLLLDATWRSRQVALAVLVLGAAVVIAYGRFVFRPDIVLMLCLAVSVHALARVERDPGSRALLAIPLVALLWGNVHGSVPVLLIPFIAYVGAAVLCVLAARAGLSWPQAPRRAGLARVLAVLVVAVLASLLNPNGLEQWTFVRTMMGTDWYRDEIIELQPPTWDTNPWPFVVVPVAFASFVLAGGRASLYRLLLLVPFSVLAFTSMRYVFLLAVVAAPIVAENLWLFARRVRVDAWTRARPAVAAAGVAMVAVSVLILRGFPSSEDARVRVGFAADLSLTPEAALAYMDRRGITGNLYNTFELGGYIAWRDFPVRRPFIDGRGALPPDLLETQTTALGSIEALDELDRRYGVDALLIVRASGQVVEPSLDVTVRHPAWALVYWDDELRVYLRRDGPYAGIAAADEYRHVKPDNGFAGIRILLRNDATRRATIEELRRCVTETGSHSARVLLAFALNQTGQHEAALESLRAVRAERVGRPGRVLQALKARHLLLAHHQAGVAYQGLGRISESIAAFEAALAVDDDPAVRLGMALSLLRGGQPARALGHLRVAAESTAAPLSVYQLLERTYRMLGREADAEAAGRRYEALRRQAGITEIFDRGVRAMVNHDYRAAVTAFHQVIERDPDSADALSNLGFAYYDLGNLDEASHFQRAALAADPEYANAHYGMAQVLTRRGDVAGAVQHLQAYLELRPSGYFARRAKRHLEALRR